MSFKDWITGGSEKDSGSEVETPLPETTSEPATSSEAIPENDGLAASLAPEGNGKPVVSESVSGNDAPPKKKRGRPVKHGRYSKAMGSDGKTAVKTPGVPPPIPQPSESVPKSEAPPRTALPSSLVKKIVREGLAISEKKLYNAIESKGKLAGLTIEEIEPQLRQAALSDAQKDLVGELAPHVLQEWGMSPELSPTVAVAVILAPWSFAGISAFRTLSKLAEEKAAREIPESKPTENTIKNHGSI